MSISNDIVKILRANCLDSSKFYPLHEPTFAGNEIKYTGDCIETGWVSSAGKYVEIFEEKLAEFTGTKRAIAVSNGTSALHVCLLLTGVSMGDEVLCPA